ncbi:hypothetical protein RB195_011404 [Necator americanus]|uniref:Uncharacterized protein n=1 Tax=Necator americanus TaxID=51031 RepID=A0ABR1D289_NECAM
MTSKDGLAKDGLSYRSDIFTMDILTAIYVYACILWIVLLITVIFNSIHTRPVKQKKQKDFELLHVSSDRQKSEVTEISGNERNQNQVEGPHKNKRCSL